MSPAEAALLLGVAAAYDNRTVSEIAARAWAEALAGVELADAKAVVVEHYRRTRDWIMPADVLAGVKAMQRARLAAAPPPLPSTDPDNVREYLAETRALRAQIASGQINPNQIGA